MHKAGNPQTENPTAPFSSNGVRLSPRECLVAAIILAGLFYLVPRLWERAEKFNPEPDYRIPFSLGSDYRMYSRFCRRAGSENKTLLVGDSVVWGHYVHADQTLSHYLNRAAGEDRFANLGVDGIHPAAMAGLVEYYGRDISRKDVILHCNPLWMSSRRHDLQIDKEFSFNHPELVPQFLPQIPCYRETLSGRLAIAVDRHVSFFAWARHVRIACFDNTDLSRWTIEHPKANPAAALTLELPSPNEKPRPEPIARPWEQRDDIAAYKSPLPRWVKLETSFQWHSFTRTVEILRSRGNRVFVLVGPFNEHMLGKESLPAYRKVQAQMEAWLRKNRLDYYVPPALPSEHYADASHPLAGGYALLAEELFGSESFARFRAAE